MSNTRTVRVAGLACATLATLGAGLGCGAATNHASDNNAPGQVPSSSESCRIPNRPGADARVWSAGDDAQAAIEVLGRSLSERFGGTSKTSYPQLEGGLVGVAIDDPGQAFVVVVDPAKVDEERLEAELQKAVGAALSVRVQASCRTAHELLNAVEVIGERAWLAGAAETSYAVDLDPHESRWQVVCR